MSLHPTRTPKSAGRKIALTLLGVLATLALGAITLAFAASPKPDYSLSASPATQTITAGGSATYAVSVNRVNGFSGSVSLSVSGLPGGASASWKLSGGPSSANTITVPSGSSGATLTIQTANATTAGTFAPKITGVSGSLSRSTTVGLVVQAPTAGNATFGLLAPAVAPSGLYPGGSRNLDVRLRNPNNFVLKVTEIKVAVDDATTGGDGACSGTANYATRPYSGSSAILVPADGQWHALSSLGVSGRYMPKVEMLDRPVNQDGCKNATITLRYSGSATK